VGAGGAAGGEPVRLRQHRRRSVHSGVHGAVRRRLPRPVDRPAQHRPAARG
jgi:hypothetical protein